MFCPQGGCVEAPGGAAELIRKTGIDRHGYFELLTATFFIGPVFTNYSGPMADEESQPARFAAPLGEKAHSLHRRRGGVARVGHIG